jgi:ATP-dependent DNA ligase
MSYIGAMLAHEFEAHRVRYPVAVEEKLDGFRCAFVGGAGYTRNGKSYESFEPFARVLAPLVGRGVHVDCELMARNWNETSKLLKRIKDVDVVRIRREVTCFVFDIFSEGDIGRWPYEKRRAEVVALAREAQKSGLRFEETEARLAHDEDEIREALEAAIRRGREGVMIKALDGVYQVKRSHAWMKLKPFKDVTLTIIGAECGRGLCPDCATVKAKAAGGKTAGCRTCAGTGEIEKSDLLGALVCENSGGETVKVGGGFSADQRIDFWRDRKALVGQKIDVKVQADQGNEIVARHPVWMRFREDI